MNQLIHQVGTNQYSFVGYESKILYVFPSSMLDINLNFFYLCLLDINPKLCLFLFIGHESKFPLKDMINCGFLHPPFFYIQILLYS